MKFSIDTYINSHLFDSFKAENKSQLKYELRKKPEKQKQYKYWTLSDDEKLSVLVVEKDYDWKIIAAEFPSRSPADVEQRWRQRIDPSTKKTSWTKEEDQVLWKLHNRFGGKWKVISEYLPGRLPSSIKNRYYGKIFKQKGKQLPEMQQESNQLLGEIDEMFIENFLDLTDDEIEYTEKD